MVAAVASSPGFVVSARAAVAKTAGRLYAAARAGAASALGVAGLASITAAAGGVDWRLGCLVGGVLAVWLASLLPDGKTPAGRR